MKKNMGAADRAFRIIVGTILILAAIFVVKSTFWTALLVVVGILWLLTGLVSRCPVYLPFGLNTGKAKEKSA